MLECTGLWLVWGLYIPSRPAYVECHVPKYMYTGTPIHLLDVLAEFRPPIPPFFCKPPLFQFTQNLITFQNFLYHVRTAAFSMASNF